MTICLHRVFVGHVAGDGHGVGAAVGDFFDARMSRLRVDIGDRQLGAFSGEALHDGAADAASAAGDDGYFVIDISHEIPSVVGCLLSKGS